LSNEDFWRYEINKLDMDLPSDGAGPVLEKIEKPDKIVQVQRITTVVYMIYDPVTTHKYNHQASMSVDLLGEMPMSEAVKMVGKKKKST